MTMDAADDVRILTPYWEKTGAFERRAGKEATWVVRSWGPSRTADRLAAILPAAREDLRSAPGTAEGDHHVFFVEESAGDWEWAHAVVRACQRASSRPGTRLWIVTRTGLRGPARDGVPRPEQDFAWALGRCHAVENPGSWGGLVDLDVDDPGVAAAMLADYLLSGSAEDEVVLHDDGWSVARLRASTLPPVVSGRGISMERLHIVSGGMMGLSFEIERWLARNGAKRLLVLGQSALDGDRKRNLRQLESLGCAAEYEVLDVGDPEPVRRLTARLRGEAVGGVFHLASRWQADGRSSVASLGSTTPEQTRLLLGAKAGGALLLSELAEEVGAEAMVLFSSAAATLGSPGQANYAAANAVLDGVARRLHGGPVRPVSIAWGPIGDVGFGATPEGADLHEVWERLGLRRLTVDQVLSTVGMALAQDEPNLTVVAWDESALSALPWFRERPVLEQLAAVESVGMSLELLTGLDEERRVDLVAEVIRAHLATMLLLDLQDVDPHRPLFELGIDSLIALELLFVIDREFAVRFELDELLVNMDITLRTLAVKLGERIR
ncbi:beta-ketoacyl reductase [Herbidospora mongoliensis]|uniref:beta-ketoacyl reductase n=1 Tax=Herbidospora mongoliensis TaxID=688067 RepID=UPI000834497B|nr:beta-ketoacyl reductase [Herbidospora mongoliensis]